MRKHCTLFFLVILLSGCAAYKIQEDKGGFAVSRYKKIIPEYTQGADKSFPDKDTAQERFKRRRVTVEYYYKKMGFIENRFKQVFVDPPVFFVKFVTGVFRIPFIAVSDYKYNHNPAYREKIDRLEDEDYEAQKARVKKLKEELSAYINEDLSKEPYPEPAQKPAPKTEIKPEPEAVKTKVVEALPAKPDEVAAVALPVIPVEEARPKPEAIKAPVVLPGPTAVIIAKPQNGPSPLKVNFYGSRSKSPNGRIASYEWNFGDGDKSNKPNPSNTYWSTTYGTREFTATLTVTDNKGMVSSASAAIQVVNK